MKNSEFKKEISKKPEESILRNHIYKLQLPTEEYSANLDLIGLHKIIEEKNKKWNNEATFPQFELSIRFFDNLLTAIENSILSHQQDNAHHTNILRCLNKADSNILFPDSTKSLFLQNICDVNPQYFQGALSVFAKKIEPSYFHRFEFMQGMLLGFQFENQKIDVLSSSETNKMSYDKFIHEFEIGKLEVLRDFDSVVNETQEKARLEIKKLKDLLDSWDLLFENQLNDLTSKVDTQINISTTAGQTLLKKSLSKKIQLENAYRTDLSLKAPAEYWRERATKLNQEGKKFLNWLAAFVIIGIVFLFSLLWLSPDEMLISIFSNDPAKAIRWSIIFITMISLLFVGIQAVKKAMFSSFHLARDAEEREKLTIFYLSLIKDTTITQEDRNLVLQALFSRSDTGMLKDEASPTMPGFLDKIK